MKRVKELLLNYGSPKRGSKVRSAALGLMLLTQIQGISAYNLGSNFTLSDLIKKVEAESEYLFVYGDDVNVNNTISVSTNVARAEDYITVLKKDQSYLVTIDNNYVIIKNAQKQTYQTPVKDRIIKGTVFDETGEVIIGANVVVLGTTNGTITDFDGNFSLSVPDNSQIKVTYIGYQSQNVAVKDKKELEIKLVPDTKALAEVVVVGYGTQKKVNLTGAVASIDMKETLGDRPVTSITSALQGAVPGLKIDSQTGTPGESMNYNIRGTTSINGGAPLVLVNNVPMDINMVDPQEVESVSILKDAASAAIYGARAAFGVILITTKQGKKDSSPVFNYNNNISFSKPQQLPRKASPLESVQAYKQMGWSNDTYIDGKNITDWEEYILDYTRNPEKYPLGYTFDDKGNLFLMRENDMFADMMERTGFSQNHNFSVSGGSPKSQYRIGVGYTGEDGILDTDKDKYGRINLSSFLGIDVTPWMTTQLDLKYANSSQNKIEEGGRGGVWGSAMSLPSYHNILPYEQDGITYDPETSGTYVRRSDPRIIKRTDFRSLGRIILTPLKGLKLTGEYTYNRTSKYENMYRNKYQFIGMNFTGIMNNVENSSYALTQSYTDYHSLNLLANYDLTIGKHELAVMGGFNQEASAMKSQYSHKKDVLISELPSLSLSTGTTTSSDSFEDYAIRGLFYRFSYAYASKYLLEANGRYDGSSRFPKENRFGFFPSFSAGWRVSEESFMAGTRDYLSNLKLRGSWGAIGNQIILKPDNTPDNYPYIPEMNVYESSWLVDGQKVTTLGMPLMVSNSFGWEKVYTLDLGVDIDLFDNRLNTTFDWYRRDTKGMLAPGMDLPWVVGTAAAKQNAADLKTYGWELKINWRDKIKNFEYRLGFNLYDSQSEITKYNNESGILGVYRKGMKMNEIWGYVTDRFYTVDDFNPDGSLKEGIPVFKGAGKVYPGDVLYKNFDDDTKTIHYGDNTYNNPGDKRIIGNSTPRFHFGFNAGVSWKGFDLSVFLRGVGKRDYWRQDQIAYPDAGWGSLFNETLDFWTPENPNAYFPRIYANNSVSTSYNRQVQTKYLANGAFLKLQNVTLSYSIPKRICDKLYLDNIKVFSTGENLYTWDYLPEGLDPESLNKNAWVYPFMRKISLGINVTF